MRTEVIEIYKFNELCESAQQAAIESYCQSQSEWFNPEFVIDDFCTVAEILGIELKTHDVKTYGGDTRQKPNIWYSGFCSQGDGASFEGRFTYNQGMLAKIKAYAPQDETLHGIAKELTAISKRFFYGIECTIGQSDSRYCHEYTMQINEAYDQNGDYLDAETEALLLEYFRDLARWLYARLESEYEYQTSEEVAREYLSESDNEFYVHGESV